MNWDRRHKTSFPSADLPLDYLKLVEETLTNALEKGLNELKKIYPESKFKSNGAIYGDEVLLAITLSHGTSNLAATTVYASADYNPARDVPGLELTLSGCLDAVGTVFEFYLDTAHPERIEQIAYRSLSALEEAPFEWTPVEQEVNSKKVAVWVKMDKSNPELDRLTEEWLQKNDPEYKKLNAKEVKPEEAEAFLEERLEAIKNAKSGTGSGQSGPITH